MLKLNFGSLGKWGVTFACCALIGCNDSEEGPAPAAKLPGKWKLKQEYRGSIYYDASGAVTRHDRYSRSGEPDEYLEIGDSAWVFLPATSIWGGTRDGMYKLKDSTVVVKLHTQSAFNFPLTDTYTISALDAHQVVIREKEVFNDRAYYYKWVYSR